MLVFPSPAPALHQRNDEQDCKDGPDNSASASPKESPNKVRPKARSSAIRQEIMDNYWPDYSINDQGSEPDPTLSCPHDDCA